jgi:hypothetical protein
MKYQFLLGHSMDDRHYSVAPRSAMAKESGTIPVGQVHESSEFCRDMHTPMVVSSTSDRARMLDDRLLAPPFTWL